MGGFRSAWLWGAGAGVFYALCWMPLGLSPFLPIALALLIRGVEAARRPRDAVLVGLAQGIAQYAVGAHFFIALARYSWPAAFTLYVVVIVQILPYTVLQAWGAYALERRTGLPRWAGLGVLWTLFEFLRTLGDVSFPADLASHAFGNHPAWLAWSPWIGPFRRHDRAEFYSARPAGDRSPPGPVTRAGGAVACVAGRDRAAGGRRSRQTRPSALARALGAPGTPQFWSDG